MYSGLHRHEAQSGPEGPPPHRFDLRTYFDLRTSDPRTSTFAVQLHPSTRREIELVLRKEIRVDVRELIARVIRAVDGRVRDIAGEELLDVHTRPVKVRARPRLRQPRAD